MAHWNKLAAVEPDKLSALRVRATDEAPLSRFHQGQRAQRLHTKSEWLAAICSPLAELEVTPIEQTPWRVAWKSRDVTQGGTGGRWTPVTGPEALYLSDTADGHTPDLTITHPGNASTNVPDSVLRAASGLLGSR